MQSCSVRPADAHYWLWNKSRAVASNLYLLLSPRGAFRDALETNPKLYAAVFAALQEIDADKFIRERRVYGGGLYKMEPKELGRLPADGVLKLMRGTGMTRQEVLFEGG